MHESTHFVRKRTEGVFFSQAEIDIPLIVLLDEGNSETPSCSTYQVNCIQLSPYIKAKCFLCACKYNQWLMIRKQKIVLSSRQCIVLVAIYKFISWVFQRTAPVNDSHNILVDIQMDKDMQQSVEGRTFNYSWSLRMVAINFITMLIEFNDYIW